MMSINVCLVGAGRIGRIHAGNVVAHEALTLRYVVDVDAAAASELAASTGAGTASIEAALADSEVDAVIIASSTDTHLPLLEACADAGLPVLCEKPLDLDVERAARCVDVAASAGIVLRVGFNRRFDASFRRLRTEIRAGAVGRVESILITSRDPSPPPIEYVRRSGGLFRDMTIHDFDMARWLLPEEPARIFATGACLIDDAIGDAGDIDSATVVLETRTGRTCQIINSRRCSYGYDQRIEVFGETGMVRAGNRTATTVEVATSGGVTTEPALPFFLERYAEAYQAELDAFLAAIRRDLDELATADDGLRALLLAEAAERALQSGSSVAVDG